MSMFEKILSTLQIKEQILEAQVPVTTRGVGFTLLQCLDVANAIVPQAMNVSGLTPQTAYRVALLQLQTQEQQAELITTRPLPCDVIAAKQVDRISLHIVRAVRSDGESTFTPVANVIENVGVLKVDAKQHFKTFVSPHATQIVHVQRQAVTIGNNRRQMIEVEEHQTLPNPFCITITSLRDVVVALSNVETPEPQRRYFIQWNPLLGANFQNQVLENPDAIMPPNYFINGIYADDLRRWRNFLGACSRRMPSLIRPLSYSGRAGKVILASSPAPPVSHLNGMRAFLEHTVILSIMSLTKQELFLGGLAMLGELPPPAEGVALIMEGYGLREPYAAVTQLPRFSWSAAIDDIFMLPMLA